MSDLTIDDSVRGLIRMLEERLERAGIVSARAEAEWLLAEALGTPRTELYLREEPLEPQLIEAILGLLAQRVHGEPLQYVLRSTEFWGHRLAVAPGVFIPRPETEVLVERAIHHLQGVRRRTSALIRVLDVGTGSANIPISLTRAIASCVVVAVELSWEALCIAWTNIQAHHVGDRIHLIRSDWTTAVHGTFDLLISNPPYVCTAAVEREAASGRQREPRMSLDGGGDGMMFHRRLFAEAARLLSPDGVLGFECAETQAHPLASFASRQPWVKRVEIVEDLAGRPRGLFIEKRDQ